MSPPFSRPARSALRTRPDAGDPVLIDLRQGGRARALGVYLLPELTGLEPAIVRALEAAADLRPSYAGLARYWSRERDADAA